MSPMKWYWNSLMVVFGALSLIRNSCALKCNWCIENECRKEDDCSGVCWVGGRLKDKTMALRLCGKGYEMYTNNKKDTCKDIPMEDYNGIVKSLNKQAREALISQIKVLLDSVSSERKKEVTAKLESDDLTNKDLEKLLEELQKETQKARQGGGVSIRFCTCTTDYCNTPELAFPSEGNANGGSNGEKSGNERLIGSGFVFGSAFLLHLTCLLLGL